MLQILVILHIYQTSLSKCQDDNEEDLVMTQTAENTEASSD